MNPILQLLLLMIFNCYNCLIISKTATIYPNTTNPNQNGVNITTLHAHHYSDRWLLYKSNPIQGFDLQLILNESWAFHPTENTTLTLEVSADKNTSSTARNYLMLAFSQNKSKYFTTRISLDESDDDHRFYPACQREPPYNQTYVNGNVRNIVDTYSNEFSEYAKATFDAANDYLNPFLEVSARNVESPLTFILFNNPMANYMLFTYTNPNIIARSCGFIKMDSAKEIEIYFASDSTWSSVDINSITITHAYTFTTNQPTNTPTHIPTNTPTRIPTNTPTVIPTNTPTVIPTLSPTIISTNSTSIPTNYPTLVPTSIPSKQPTKYPTIIPSLNPTQYTNIPSKTPTLTPTDNPTIPQSMVHDITTTVLKDDFSDNFPGSDSENEYTTLYILIGSISAVLCVIIISIAMMFFKLRKKTHQQRLKMIITPQTTCTTSVNNITEMVIKPDYNPHDTHNEFDNEDLYDKVQSVEMVTPQSNVNVTNGNGIVEGGNIMYNNKYDDNDEMYNTSNTCETVGATTNGSNNNNVSDKSTNNTAKDSFATTTNK